MGPTGRHDRNTDPPDTEDAGAAGRTVDLSELKLERLDRKRHDRESFASGDSAIDSFLKTLAAQQQARHEVVTTVACDGFGRIYGFYALTIATYEPADLGVASRYDVRAILLARLGVDVSVRGRGLGGRLVAEAMRRAISTASDVGFELFVVDAKNETARAWYRRLGFVESPIEPMRLFMRTKELADHLDR